MPNGLDYLEKKRKEREAANAVPAAAPPAQKPVQTAQTPTAPAVQNSQQERWVNPSIPTLNAAELKAAWQNKINQPQYNPRVEIPKDLYEKGLEGRIVKNNQAISQTADKRQLAKLDIEKAELAFEKANFEYGKNDKYLFEEYNQFLAHRDNPAYANEMKGYFDANAQPSFEAYKEAKQIVKSQNEERIKEENRKQEVRYQKEYIPNKIQENSKGYDEAFKKAMETYPAPIKMPQDYTPDYRLSLPEVKNWNTANNILRDAQKTINAPEKGSGAWSSMGKGFVDVIASPDFWTLGLSGLSDNLQAKPILEKNDRGEKLSPSEEAVMDALYTRVSANALRANDISNYYKGGEVFANSLPFMAQMAASGGIAEGAIKGAEKLAQRSLLKYIEKKAIKKFGKEAFERAVKAAGSKVGSGIIKGAQEAIVGIPTRLLASPFFYNNIVEGVSRQVVDRKEIKQADGTIKTKYITEEGRGVLKAAGDAYIEYLTELPAGEAISKGIKIAANTFTKNIMRGTIKDISNSIFSGQFGILQKSFRQAGFHGLVPEMLEEHVGELLRYVTGINTADDLRQFYSKDNQLSMLLGFTPMSVFGVGGNVISRNKVYNNHKTANANLTKTLSLLVDKGRVSDIIQGLDNMPIDNMGESILRLTMSLDGIDENGNLNHTGKRLQKEISEYMLAKTQKVSLDAVDTGKDNGNAVFENSLPSLIVRDGDGLTVKVHNPFGEVLLQKSFEDKEAAADFGNRCEKLFLDPKSAFIEKAKEGYTKTSEYTVNTLGQLLFEDTQTIREATMAHLPNTEAELKEGDRVFILADNGENAAVGYIKDGKVHKKAVASSQVQTLWDVDANTFYFDYMQSKSNQLSKLMAQTLDAEIEMAGIAETEEATQQAEEGTDETEAADETDAAKEGVYLVIDGQVEFVPVGDGVSITDAGDGLIDIAVEKYNFVERDTVENQAKLKAEYERAPLPPPKEGELNGAERQAFYRNLPKKSNKQGVREIDEEALMRSPQQYLQYAEYEVSKEGAFSIAQDQYNSLQKKIESIKRQPKTVKAIKLIDDLNARLSIYGKYIMDYKSRWSEAEKAETESQKAKTKEQKRLLEAQKADSDRENANAIVQRWSNAAKAEGNRNVIVLPNGERIAGRYVLTEAGAYTPSHDINRNFAPSEGFPVNERLETVNDRNYEKDKVARHQVIAMAQQYDSRALQEAVVVTPDGIVVSGNNRTMSGILAAQNNTDGKYNGYVKEFAENYGFSKEQVSQFKHPRIVFQTDAAIPYTTENFAKFNANEKKTQNTVEKAVKIGKTVSDSTARKLIDLLSKYESLSDAFNSVNLTEDVLRLLSQDGVILTTEQEQYVIRDENGAVFNRSGKEFVETLLLGKIADEEAIRKLYRMGDVRKNILRSIFEINKNATFDEYSLKEELNEAISLVYRSRAKTKQGVRLFSSVEDFLRQMNMFDANANVQDRAIVLLSQLLDGKDSKRLNAVFEGYNNTAEQAVNGQIDMFEGGVLTKGQILTEAINSVGNGNVRLQVENGNKDVKDTKDVKDFKNKEKAVAETQNKEVQSIVSIPSTTNETVPQSDKEVLPHQAENKEKEIVANTQETEVQPDQTENKEEKTVADTHDKEDLRPKVRPLSETQRVELNKLIAEYDNKTEAAALKYRASVKVRDDQIKDFNKQNNLLGNFLDENDLFDKSVEKDLSQENYNDVYNKYNRLVQEAKSEWERLRDGREAYIERITNELSQHTELFLNNTDNGHDRETGNASGSGYNGSGLSVPIQSEETGNGNLLNGDSGLGLHAETTNGYDERVVDRPDNALATTGDVAAASVGSTRRGNKKENAERNALGGVRLGKGLVKRINETGKRPTNEEIAVIADSITAIAENGTVTLTGEVTDNIRDIVSQYQTGGISKSGRGILDEYYTPADVVELVKGIISPLLADGKPIEVLEPSVGIGNFLHAAPTNAKVTAFEINPTTARIAKILHPNATINLRAFETEFITEKGKKKMVFPYYDLVIGNPPYGEHRGKYKGLGELPNKVKYEDYFIQRGLDSLRNGGILAMVVPSSQFKNTRVFPFAELVEAYRLPNGVFEGTDVGTDIVIIRKTSRPLDMVVYNNDYFTNHPDHVLGKTEERTNRFGRTEKYVKGNTENVKETIEKLREKEAAKELLNKKNPTNDEINAAAEVIEETATKEGAKQVIKENKKQEEGLFSENNDNNNLKVVKDFNKRIVVRNWKEFKVPKGQVRFEMQKSDEVVPLQDQFKNNDKLSKEQTDGFTTEYIDSFGSVNYAGEFHRGVPAAMEQYANYYKGEQVHDFYYAEGDIYDKLTQLERDKKHISSEQYKKQKQLLDSVLPPIKPLEEINLSPNVEFVKNLTLYVRDKEEEHSMLRPKTVQELFFEFIEGLPYDAMKPSSPWEVKGYVENKQVHGKDKERNQAERDRRKKVGNDLFKKFLAEELTDEQRSIIEAAYNRQYNAIYRPDYAKVPLKAEIYSNFKIDKSTGQPEPLKLTDVQLAGIGRLNTKGIGLLAHEVGFGKTLCGVIAMHEAMARGNASRPIIVVPNNSILKQWVQTIYETVPNAKVNILGNMGADYDLKDFKVADGEISIVTYDGFKRLGFSDGTYDTLAGRFSYISDDLDAHKSERDMELEKEKIAENRGKMERNTNYSFEDLGFDHLTFDEIHNANHIVSKVKLDKAVYSDFRNNTQRTSDLGIKTWIACHYIQDNHNERNITLLSATPFTNKPLEYYSILSLMGNETLQRMGFFNVNEFFETFMEADNDIEILANGTAKEKTNVRRFKNNGLFQQLLSEYVDIKGNEDNKELVRPDKQNREYKVEQNGMTEKLMEKAIALMEDPEMTLKGITNARLIAFSPYASTLSSNSPKDYKEFVNNSPKIKAAMDLVKQNYSDNKESGQVLYSEIGTEFFPYIKEYLIKEAGFADNEVAIIDGKTAKNTREVIKEKYNDNEVKVVIGSPAIKEGMDLQQHTSDIFMLSLPYNFTQLRQIEGRGWRQGNKWKRIRVNYMLTNNSIDVFMLQKLQIKQNLYDEAMKAKADVIDVSDINTGEIKMELITDPARRAELEVMKDFSRLQSQIDKEQADLAFKHRKLQDLTKAKKSISECERILNNYKEYAKEDNDGWWEKQVPAKELEVAKAKRDYEDVKNKMREKGIDVDNIERAAQDTQERINALEEIKKKLQEEKIPQLTAKYKKEQQTEKKKYDVESYVKERAEENQKGYYELDPKAKLQIVGKDIKDKFTSINEKEFNTLIDRLSQTGLAKDVITAPAEMWRVLEKELGKEDAARFMSVWHGSPYSFDKFLKEKFLTGEGAMIYGAGFYFTDKREIAKNYALQTNNRKRNTDPITINGENFKDYLNRLEFSLSMQIPSEPETLFDLVRAADRAYLDSRVKSKTRQLFMKQKYQLLSDLQHGNITGFQETEPNIYKVKIHGDKAVDDLNFLRWDKPITHEQSQAILKAIENLPNSEFKENELVSPKRVKEHFSIILNDQEARDIGSTLYSEISHDIFGSDKKASDFLLLAGIDGIQYPTEYQSKGTHDKSYNYVVFDENAIDITDKIRLMATSKGEVYGFVTQDGKVYIDGNKMNANTPIHEFGHLWNSFIKENHTELWNKGVELIKGSKYWEEVNSDKNYSHLSEEQKVDEAIARAIGDRGEQIVQEKGLFKRLTDWLSEVWEWLGTKLGIRDLTAEQIQNLTLEQFTEGAVGDILSGEKIENKETNDLNKIKEAAIGNGTFMKAPNGKPTNLNKRQWLQVRTEAFKAWFGDWENDPENASKVVDRNGEPMILWHAGTLGKLSNNYIANPLTHFGTEQAAKDRTNGLNKKDYQYTKTFLNLKNPYDIYSDLGEWDLEMFKEYLKQDDANFTEEEVENFKSLEDVVSALKEKGFDSIQYENQWEDKGSISYMIFNPNQIKSAADNNGDFDKKNNDIRFQIVSTHNELSDADKQLEEKKDKLLSSEQQLRDAKEVKDKAKAVVSLSLAKKAAQSASEDLFKRIETIGISLNEHYKPLSQEDIDRNKKIDNSLYRKFIYNFQDEDDPINQLQKKVESLGGKVTDGSNMYEDKNHSYYRATDRQSRFEDNEMKAITEAYKEIIKSIKTLDPLKTLIWKKTGKPLNDREKISVYLQAKDIQEAIEMELPDRGELGFIDELGMYHQEYIDLFEKSVQKEQIEQLHKAIKSSTQFSLDILKEHGLIDEGTYDKFSQRKYYVPERGWQERDMLGRKLHFIEGGDLISSNPYNAAMAKAKGRPSLASDPIAYIQSIGHSSILSAEKNRSKIAALNFVLQNENIGREYGLFGFRRVWYVENGEAAADGNPLYDEVYRRPSQELFDAGKVHNEVNNAYKRMLSKGEAAQREVVVYANGQRYELWFSNELIANGLNRNAERSDVGNIAKYTSNFTRYMSGLMTQYNPSFALWNLARDTGTALSSNWCTYGMGFNRAFVRNWKNRHLSAAIWQHITGVGTSNTIFDQRLRAFFEDGAATGFSYLKDLKQLQRNFEKETARAGLKNAAYVTAKFLPKAFSALTEYSELLTRFAQYCALLDKGCSRFQAATGAKNVSVNFNRRGAKRFLSSFFAFYNATVQGTAKLGQMFYAHKGKFSAVASLLVAFGAVNTLFLPDDPDKERAWGEYDRMQNIVIGNWKLPLPQGLRVFWAAGVQAAFAMQNKKSIGQAIMDAVKYACQELLPVDVLGGLAYDDKATYFPITYNVKNGLLEFVPTAARPVAEVGANRTFTGAKIHPESFNKNMPQTLLGHKTVNPFMQNFTDFLFQIGGGDKGVPSVYLSADGKKVSDILNWNPSDIEHLIAGYTGGVGKFIMDSYHSVSNAAGGKFDPSVVPLLNRAYKPYNEEKVRSREMYDLKAIAAAFEDYTGALKRGIAAAYKKGDKAEAERLKQKLREAINNEK